MFYRSNAFRDDLLNEHGHLMLDRVKPGQTFDKANDCLLTEDGKHIVFRHTEWDKRRKGNIKRGNSLLGDLCDALIVWERAHNSAAAFASANTEHDEAQLGF